MESAVYSLSELASLLGKSPDTIYRRLTEKPSRFTIKFARKEGGRWAFDRKRVNEAIDRSESIIVSVNALPSVDDATVLAVISRQPRSCGKEASNG